MKIYFATWISEVSQGEALTKKGALKRLVSYHFLTEQKISGKRLSVYTRTGTSRPTKRKKK